VDQQCLNCLTQAQSHCCICVSPVMARGRYSDEYQLT
jgi:hypothetical protein